MRHESLIIISLILASTLVHPTTVGGSAPGQTQSPRDTTARAAEAGAPASIEGRIVAASTGQPLKRARVVATARDFRGRLSTQTDETGRYVLTDLRAGAYTLTVSKPGFITVSYGQRRSRQPATPVQVRAGQELRDISLALPAGSVITGHVADEDGAPLPLATVRLLRYVYQQGQRQLVPVGADRTDDRGQYRVFGLELGDYFVSAVVSRQLTTGGGRLGLAFELGAGGRALRPVNEPAQPDVNAPDDPLGYAPTYYPGVTSLVEAVPVTVGLSAELSGVDFAVRLVPTSTVSGVVFGADGDPATAAQVMLIPGDGPVAPGATLGARVQPEGRFEVRAVPPGRWFLRAITRGGFGGRRGGGFGGTPTFASQTLVIDGFDVTDLTLVLAPGATISGSIIFNAANQTAPADIARIRVTANSLEPVPFLANANGRVNTDGTFVLENVAGGARFVRATGVPDGWMLEAVYLNGQDVIDTPLDFDGTRRVEGVRLVLTDQVTQLSGVVHDGQGTELTDFTVIAFPIDERRWGPGSRYVQASRPDQNARYQIRGLPAGEYLLAAVDVVEQGEWHDPRFLQRLRPGALRVSLAAGELTELNITLTSQAP